MKTALLLLQLGMGDDPVKFYKGMLSDKRVRKQTILWKILLHCFILPSLAKKKKESPIIAYTEELTKKLQSKLPELEVRFALNYYNIEEVLDSLVGKVERIILQPLFPQYSSPVVGSMLERSLSHLSRKTVVPELIIGDLFYNNEEYLSALVQKIKKISVPDALILSYHSIPLSHIKAGDPYQDQCQAESEAIKKLLIQEDEWNRVKIVHAYQSKYGRGAWLEPSINDSIKEIVAGGAKSVAVLAAGFLMDCSETLNEIDKDLRAKFYDLGGEDFQYITCFNADDILSKIIECSVARYL